MGIDFDIKMTMDKIKSTIPTYTIKIVRFYVEYIMLFMY